MNFNITISAAGIHGSIVILCLATIIVSVKEALQAVSFAPCCAVLRCAVLSLSVHHNEGNVSARFGEGATRNFEFTW